MTLMKIALASDELYPVHAVIIEWLQQHNHQPICFGALKTNQTESWVKLTKEAAEAIQNGECQEGIFLCWTGTGITIAANKFSGIRAALCTDAETTRGARIWNHANVLALSNRLLSQDIAKEILTAWFDDYDKIKGAVGVGELNILEKSLSNQ
jgi:ribose 5-phosphate isomerase B